MQYAYILAELERNLDTIVNNAISLDMEDVARLVDRARWDIATFGKPLIMGEPYTPDTGGGYSDAVKTYIRTIRDIYGRTNEEERRRVFKDYRKIKGRVDIFEFETFRDTLELEILELQK